MLLSILLIFSILFSYAGKITGTVRDVNGNTLSYASITVKATSKGAITNNEGKYTLNLPPGSYTLICQYVGYKKEERTITVDESNLVVNFELSIQAVAMQEVIIKKGEDPAIEIIRQTIKKRNYYDRQVEFFKVEVYIKSLIRSRNIPEKFMGEKMFEKEDLEKTGFDSVGRGILFLSESQTRVSYKKPNEYKYEVLSARQAGGGYGIGFPFFINFYVNNVTVFTTLNPRGFLSPICDNAFHYYKFHYEGSFNENDKIIDRIRVTPKRKNEPLFDGYLLIVDGEWRIHSLDLTITKDYQLQLIDTARITQIHTPVTASVWRIQNQMVYISANNFGFGWTGNFLNVYANYNLDPGFTRKTFTRTIMSYDTAYNKKDSSYWNAVRPIPLEPEEKKDFTFKDSLYKKIRDSFLIEMNMDTTNRKPPPITLKRVLLSGVERHHNSANGFFQYRFDPLLMGAQYNTVEGFVGEITQSFQFSPRSGKKRYYFNTDTRYGFTNHHFNAIGLFGIKPKKDFFQHYIEFSGGKRVSQFNHDNPIDPSTNTVYTLFFKKNYMKIYENWFGKIEYNSGMENGLKWNIDATYEDRIPLQNTTDYSVGKKSSSFLPNHPYELDNIPFYRHQAFVTSITLSYQPGQHYIELPDMKFSIGSKYPTFEAYYSKGISSFGSDVDFDKWGLTVYDNLNLKLGGEFRYRVGVGGFMNATHVEIPDFQHFNGNQTYRMFSYLNSFQMAPYYRYSNTEKFYTEAHAEHHFNGLLTNKIPVLNKWKWTLVAGTNTFYVNRNNYYTEAFVGIENIFKLYRVDFITAYQAQPGHYFGVRWGLGGIFGGKAGTQKRR
jgi:hypothetical protein